MLKQLKYEWALRRLQQKDKTRASYVEPYRAAVANKDVDEIERLDSEETHETQSIEDKIARLQTSFLIEEARRLLIPTPAFDSKEDGAWEEKKERRESLQSWAALSIGLVGALTGLFSALKK